MALVKCKKKKTENTVLQHTIQELKRNLFIIIVKPSRAGENWFYFRVRERCFDEKNIYKWLIKMIIYFYF